MGLTFDVAGADSTRRRLLSSIKPDRINEATSILDLLDRQPTRERSNIEHDARVFGDLLDPEMRPARFTPDSGRGVRIYVHDNAPLEHVLGTDLLIYQERYGSFLLIQYKNMERISATGGQDWSYLADDHLRDQLWRMSRAETAIRNMEVPEGGISDWRLYDSPFYWKFCENTRPASRDFSLLGGIILSAEHLAHFLASSESDGEHGGKRIGYPNCSRYLNNSQFINLARHGWIGCGPQGVSLIAELLKENLSNGERAMLAVIEGALEKGASGRGWRR